MLESIGIYVPCSLTKKTKAMKKLLFILGLLFVVVFSTQIQAQMPYTYKDPIFSFYDTLVKDNFIYVGPGAFITNTVFSETSEITIQAFVGINIYPETYVQGYFHGFIAPPSPALKKASNKNYVKFYPNPFRDVLNVLIPDGYYQISIVNMLGQVVQQKIVFGNFIILKGNLGSGAYLLKIASRENIQILKINVE